MFRRHKYSLLFTKLTNIYQLVIVPKSGQWSIPISGVHYQSCDSFPLTTASSISLYYSKVTMADQGTVRSIDDEELDGNSPYDRYMEDSESESDSEEEYPESEEVRKIDDFLAPLILDEAKLYSLARRFSEVYQHLARTSDQQFLPTPVTRLPTGQETGRYLAIDVGGSNLRVAFIELLGEAADFDVRSTGSSDKSRDTIRKAQRQRVKRTSEKAWPIGEHLKMDKADDLFAWIGDCIAEVVADNLTSDATKGDIPAELEMGITFSFPIM